MKYFRILGISISAVLVSVAGVLALTNPDQSSYEEYATERLVVYLQDNVCTATLNLLGTSLRQECNRLLVQNRSDIQQLVVKGTTRQNFGVFSLYKTDLSIKTVFPFLPSDLLPAYQFETIGVLQQFHTYKAQQR